MLKLKSGRVVFFEGIVGMTMEGKNLVIELATKEQIELAGITLEEMVERRNEYFQELAVKGSISEDFGNKVYAKLKDELQLAISTLQSATIAYETSATLANRASHTLVQTSDAVDVKAEKLFKKSATVAERAATRFSGSVDRITSETLEPAVSKLVGQVDKLATELEHI